ncbi:MAG: rhodanese-related sulfurtransferase [Cyclobacteriaceae bacterium]
MDYRILLFYCYANIDDIEAYRNEHHLFCIENNIRGRIIISAEGLNGSVSGLEENCEKYMAYVRSDARFSDTEFKIDQHHEHAFAKINVRAKDEIVHSGLKHINPRVKTGKHLAPHDFKSLKDQEDVVILDVRSKYEHELGHFKNAIRLDIDNFRDFPERVGELAHLKGKKILTYCTGGIKCEKASAFLLEQGFEDVYQLHGGIIKYGLEAGGEDFEGKCYVFDNRLAVEVNSINPKVVSKCHMCGEASDRMVNCANPECNVHVPICETCGWEMEGACSDDCKEHPKKRAYNGTGYYQKNSNGYNPYKGFYQKPSMDKIKRALHGKTNC